MDHEIDLSGKAYDEDGNLLFEVHGGDPHPHIDFWYNFIFRSMHQKHMRIYFVASVVVISLVMIYLLCQNTKNAIPKHTNHDENNESDDMQGAIDGVDESHKEAQCTSCIRIRTCIFWNICMFTIIVLICGVFFDKIAPDYPISDDPYPRIEDDTSFTPMFTGAKGQKKCSTSYKPKKCIGHSNKDICKLLYRQVSFPGLHNSGAFDLTIESLTGEKWGDILVDFATKGLSNLWGAACAHENHKYHWRDQLDKGIRWLDIDVCVHNGILKTCHGDAYGHYIRELLDDVTLFLTNHRDDIVTIVFKNDPGVDGKDSQKRADLLGALLTEFYGHQWCSRCIVPTDRLDYKISDMIRYNKRLVIFVDKDIRKRNSELDKPWVINMNLNAANGITDTWGSSHVAPTSKCQGPVDRAKKICANPPFPKRKITVVSLFGTWGACLTTMAKQCNDRIQAAIKGCRDNLDDTKTINTVLIDAQHVGSNDIFKEIRALNDKNIERFKNKVTKKYKTRDLKKNVPVCELYANCRGLVLFYGRNFHQEWHCYNLSGSIRSRQDCIVDSNFHWSRHDKATSAIVYEGYWILYKNPDKTKTQNLLPPGNYSYLPDHHVCDNCVSAIRGYTVPCKYPLSIWFEHGARDGDRPMFRGIHLTAWGNVPVLAHKKYNGRGLNDMFTVAAIAGGEWMTYDYDWYRGELGIVPEGVHSKSTDIAGGLCDNCIASLRIRTKKDRDTESRYNYLFRLQNKVTFRCIQWTSGKGLTYDLCDYWWGQLWQRTSADGDYFQLKRYKNKKCIANKGKASRPDGNFYAEACNAKKREQFWRFEHDDKSQFFRIINKKTGYCMYQAKDGRFGAGSCAKYGDQRWRELKRTFKKSEVNVIGLPTEYRYGIYIFAVLFAVNILCVIYYCGCAAQCKSKSNTYVKYKPVAFQSSGDEEPNV